MVQQEFNTEKFEALMKLADFKREVREGRRQLEWKFTATAFVALAGLSVFPEKAPTCLVIPAILLLCLVHTLWIGWNQNRSEEDRVEMFDYKDAAEEMLLGTKRHPENKPLPLYKQPACIFEIGTAYLIASFSITVRLLH